MKLRPVLANFCMNEILPRITSIGRKPICNLNAARAPRWNGWCFPLCWRCTAILLPYLCLEPWLAGAGTSALRTACAICCMAPAAIDGAMQYFWGRESTNLRRILTGVICGCGLALL